MNLTNKTVLITGSTDGIGKQTAIDAASSGAEIIIHGRNEERVSQTVNFIKEKTGNELIYGICADFSSLSEVNSMIKDIKDNFTRIDILINNAAEFLHEKINTSDGFERQFQVNYLAHFLITEKLLPLIKDIENSRIINVSSMIHSAGVDFDNLQAEKFYSGASVYALTKTLNILHTYKLADILKTNKTVVHCLHPGVIETKLLNAAWSGGAPVSVGAENLIYAATSDSLSIISGLYTENRRPMQSNPITYDKEIQNQLRDISLKMLNHYL